MTTIITTIIIIAIVSIAVSTILNALFSIDSAKKPAKKVDWKAVILAIAVIFLLIHGYKAGYNRAIEDAQLYAIEENGDFILTFNGEAHHYSSESMAK